MIVYAIVKVSLSTYDVDEYGSIVNAVADQLDIDAGDCVDLDEWTWQYDSTHEYKWANVIDYSPLDGTPYTAEEMAEIQEERDRLNA